MILRLLIAFFVIICGSETFFAQNYILPEGKAFQRAYIQEKEKAQYKVTNLRIDGDSLRFVNSISFKREVVAIPDVHYMRVQEGTHAGKGAGLGAGIMGGIMLIAIIRVETDRNLVFRDDAFLRTVLIVGGGMGIGALIGAMVPKWKTYYPNLLSNHNVGMKPELFIPYSHPGLGVRFYID